MNKERNDSPFWEEIKESGYLGFVLAYLRSTMDKSVFALHYDELREIASLSYTEGQDFDYVIDHAIESRLSDSQALAIEEYFGLMSYRSHTIRGTAIALNRLGSGSYSIEEVGCLMGSSFPLIGKDVEFGSEIETIFSMLEASLSENQCCDKQAVPETNDLCSSVVAVRVEECSHCCETCDRPKKKKATSKKKSTSKKASTKKKS